MRTRSASKSPAKGSCVNNKAGQSPPAKSAKHRLQKKRTSEFVLEQPSKHKQTQEEEKMPLKQSGPSSILSEEINNFVDQGQISVMDIPSIQITGLMGPPKARLPVWDLRKALKPFYGKNFKEAEGELLAKFQKQDVQTQKAEISKILSEKKYRNEKKKEASGYEGTGSVNSQESSHHIPSYQKLTPEDIEKLKDMIHDHHFTKIHLDEAHDTLKDIRKMHVEVMEKKHKIEHIDPAGIYASIVTAMDKTDNTIKLANEMKEKFDDLVKRSRGKQDEALTEAATKINTVINRVDSLEQSLASVNKSFLSLSALAQNQLKPDVDQLQKQSNQYVDRIAGQDAGIDALDGKLDKVFEEIASINEALAAQADVITGLNKTVGKNHEQFVGLVASYNGLVVNFNKNKKDFSSQLNEQQQQLQKQQGEIKSLKETIQRLEALIEHQSLIPSMNQSIDKIQASVPPGINAQSIDRSANSGVEDTKMKIFKMLRDTPQKVKVLLVEGRVFYHTEDGDSLPKSAFN